MHDQLLIFHLITVVALWLTPHLDTMVGAKLRKAVGLAWLLSSLQCSNIDRHLFAGERIVGVVF